jgi:hypothetical protein
MESHSRPRRSLPVSWAKPKHGHIYNLPTRCRDRHITRVGRSSIPPPFLSTKVIGLERVKVGDRGGVTIWRLAMFKLPSYDPVSIAVMGFGILLVAALALSLG